MTGVDLEVLCIKVTVGNLIVNDITEDTFFFLRKEKKSVQKWNLYEDSNVINVEGKRLRKGNIFQ